MPISLEPNDRRLFWLASDADKPISTRPVFICAAPTRRKTIELQRIRQQINDLQPKDTDFEERYDTLLIDGIMLGVVGWKNMGCDFNREALTDVLSDDELAEVFRGWPSAFRMTEDDRKNWQSPSESGAEKSAALVSAASA